MLDDTQNSKKEVLTPNSRRDPSQCSEWLSPYQFKPGQSGNPGGRPKRKLLTEALETLLQESNPKRKKQRFLLIAEALLKRAEKGDTAAIRETFDRVEGKSVQPISGPEGGAIPVSVEGIDEALGSLFEKLKSRKEAE